MKESGGALAWLFVALAAMIAFYGTLFVFRLALFIP
jgi:hypothetical protein